MSVGFDVLECERETDYMKRCRSLINETTLSFISKSLMKQTMEKFDQFLLTTQLLFRV